MWWISKLIFFIIIPVYPSNTLTKEYIYIHSSVPPFIHKIHIKNFCVCVFFDFLINLSRNYFWPQGVHVAAGLNYDCYNHSHSIPLSFEFFDWYELLLQNYEKKVTLLNQHFLFTAFSSHKTSNLRLLLLLFNILLLD